MLRSSPELRRRSRNPVLPGRVRIRRHPRLRAVHIAVVHEKGARLAHGDLVQFQRVGADLRRLHGVWDCCRVSQIRNHGRAVEDCVFGDGSADHVCGCVVPVDYAG